MSDISIAEEEARTDSELRRALAAESSHHSDGATYEAGPAPVIGKTSAPRATPTISAAIGSRCRAVRVSFFADARRRDRQRHHPTWLEGSRCRLSRQQSAV